VTDTPQLLTDPVSAPAILEQGYHVVSMGAEFAGPLGFQLALLRDWRTDVLNRIGPTDARPLVPMVRFFNPAGPGETVITGAHLPREVHPADWLRIYAANAGYRVLDWREQPSKFGRVGDALVAGAGRTQGLGHRLTTIKDANRIFLIDSRMAAPDPLSQEPAYMAVAHFRLLAPTGKPYAEPFRETDLAAERPVRFLVSGLWHEPEAGTPPPAGGAIRRFEHRAEDVLLGSLVAVAGVAGRNTAAELEEITLAKLAANGIIRVAGPDLLSRYNRPDGTADMLARAWRAERAGQALSLMSAQITLQGVPVALTLLGPTPETDMELWAIHRRAFDIAVNSLHPGW
jgi:hypothetical protein